MVRQANVLAQALAEIGYAQDTREQMRLADERQWLDSTKSLAAFASILEDTESFLFED
jgi:hypothetical protein